MRESHSWEDMARLTHDTQVGGFGWCSCEDGQPVFDDCPVTGPVTFTIVINIDGEPVAAVTDRIIAAVAEAGYLTESITAADVDWARA